MRVAQVGMRAAKEKHLCSTPQEDPDSLDHMFSTVEHIRSLSGSIRTMTPGRTLMTRTLSPPRGHPLPSASTVRTDVLTAPPEWCDRDTALELEAAHPSASVPADRAPPWTSASRSRGGAVVRRNPPVDLVGVRGLGSRRRGPLRRRRGRTGRERPVARGLRDPRRSARRDLPSRAGAAPRGGR